MKTCEEWSLEFDLLYQNITSNQAPGLEEYEKSVFLTRAQEAVVIGLYNGTITNPFESTEELTDYLAVLVKQADGTLVQSGVPHIVSDSSVYSLPSDMLFRTYESCKVNLGDCGETNVIVVPVTQDEFWRTSRNPFKGDNKRRVLRLAYSKFESGGEQHYSELVSKYPITSYTVRYLSRPEPIILKTLGSNEPSIDGKKQASTCKLNEALHRIILNEAVKAAKEVWKSS